jgi:hypothetical protein
MCTGQREHAVNHSSQGESNDGRAAVSVDRLIMRADTLRDSTRDLFSVWPLRSKTRSV